MRRLRVAERRAWRQRVEEQGLLFHALDDRREYWGEGAYYRLTTDEVGELERSTRELQQLCLEAAQYAIDHHRHRELGVPAAAVPLIERAWHEEPPSLYGRLDLAFGPDGVPKLLEYNADTPTSLLEAAVIQWTWVEDCFAGCDQFNAIHELLIDTWRDLAPHLDGSLVHFGSVQSVEDEMTIAYLRDTAEQAGLSTIGLEMEEIRWNGQFIDRQARRIRNLFKLYPWEGLWADPFAPHLQEAPALNWIEPVWKMLWSTKGLLPLLWELFPGHRNLLPASFEPLEGGWVKKPLHGREGSNVTIEADGVSVSSGGPYGGEPFVYQAYADLGEHDGYRPVIGSWLIGGEPAGIGIRETRGHITDNTATFVPHLIGEAT
jgi:glutathionylspermidine synthase